jgi:hypothetical protein
MIMQRTPSIPEEVTRNKDKPLPRVPSTESPAFSESRVIVTDHYNGFPKRPKIHGNGHQSVPMDPTPTSALPDGLYKGNIQLYKDMVPAIDWPGVSVKVRGFFYYHLTLP